MLESLLFFNLAFALPFLPKLIALPAIAKHLIDGGFHGQTLAALGRGVAAAFNEFAVLPLVAVAKHYEQVVEDGSTVRVNRGVRRTGVINLFFEVHAPMSFPASSDASISCFHCAILGR